MMPVSILGIEGGMKEERKKGMSGWGDRGKEGGRQEGKEKRWRKWGER